MSTAPSGPADSAIHPGPFPRPPIAASCRLILIGLALVSLAVAWWVMADLSRRDPWYDDAGMNVHNMVDALAINSDVAPSHVDQPALISKYLLALDYRVRHFTGLLPVWNLKKFGYAPDPLREIPQLLQIGRAHNRVLVIFFILTAAALVYSMTLSLEAALLAVVLLSSSAGLLFHGLTNRPDLLCAWFGIVPATFCVWRATAKGACTAQPAWLFLAGLAAGLSVLTKLPGLYYLIACFAWCWLAAGMVTSVPEAAAGRFRISTFLLSLASSGAMFWLLGRLMTVPDALTPTAITRVRLAATAVGVLPLMSLVNLRRRTGLFLRNRGLELAWLGGGALAAVILAFGALWAVMSEPRALEYLARVLEFVAHPDPHLSYLLADPPRPGHEFLRFVRESPFLFTSATVLALVVGLTRRVPTRLRAIIGLFWINAVAMTWLLAHRYFLDQFSIFAQVPLMLLWSLSLFALGVWRPNRPAAETHWMAPLVLAGAAVLLAMVFFRLEPKQQSYRTETQPPVSELTVTFLYDHDAHPERYRQIMQAHYGTRGKFSAALQRYLADPANRY